MPLTSKFLFGNGVIVLIFWCILNVVIYIYLKDNIITQTYQKTDILFSHIQATIGYIRKKVRPKLFHVLPAEEFVPEVMSVSFLNKGIMSEFRKLSPDFRYRRVAVNPMNPENAPNELELQYIAEFRKDRKAIKRGIIKMDNKKYFLHARPVIMEAECLACHGSPEKAPAKLVSLYGTQGGFNRKPGEVIGVESIAIPLDETFAQIRGLVISIFLTGIVGVLFLFLSLTYYIDIVAVRPIKNVSRFFRSVVEGEKDLETPFALKSRDEIGGLADSFNRMMEYLKNSERKYRRIFEDSRDAIIVADFTGVIHDINPAGVELFGCRDRLDTARAETLYDLFPKKEECDRLFRAMEKNGYVKDYETQLTCADRRHVDVMISASFLRDEAGRVCGFEAIIKDITEWKLVQDRMKEADRMASIGRLAAGLAHEINNPLGIIMGYTGLLIKELKDNGQAVADLQVINRNAEACKKIVEDLLNFSRTTESVPEQMNINAVIDEVLDMLSYRLREKDAAIQREYQDGIPELTADAKKIRQVFINIIMNAFQAIDRGGKITIVTVYDKSADRVRVSISDSGCGIPGENINKVFEPFFTTKQPGDGTGLGLSVSYGIVREHGGEITVESTHGKGSTFTVSLPLD